MPIMFITRVRLYASTCNAISVATFGRRFIRKCVAPILIFSVPKGCSTVSRRCRMACGFLSRRFCTFITKVKEEFIRSQGKNFDKQKYEDDFDTFFEKQLGKTMGQLKNRVEEL